MDKGEQISSSSMTKPFIESNHNEHFAEIKNEKGVITKDDILEEVKKQLWLAGPLICVSVSQSSLQLISIMFVGHLGELALSGASMATSFASVTGFILLMGMSCAMETFCGQSYGAKQYHMLGIHMQRAMFVLLLVSIPIAVIWANTGIILKVLGQDLAISEEAGLYAQYMIPSLFAYGLLQCQIRFLQTQNIVFPMLASSGITTLLHIFVCWILVYKSGLGSRGAAVATSISYWIHVVLLALYVKFSSSCAKSWTGFSKESLQDILTFIRLAVPSGIMVCLELWSFEMMVLLSGLLPNPQLETSVLSISLTTAENCWMIPFGLGASVSTRVSNELGASHPQTARLAVYVVFALAITVGILVGVVLLLIRHIWGYAYSNEVEVIRYVAAMMPILATSNIFDGIQCVLSDHYKTRDQLAFLMVIVYGIRSHLGVVRGCGFQQIGAYINLGSYYLVGLPCSVLFAFVLHFGGQGLWLGIICALLVQVFLLLFVVSGIDWNKEAKKAKDRVYDSAIPVEIIS